MQCVGQLPDPSVERSHLLAGSGHRGGPLLALGGELITCAGGLRHRTREMPGNPPSPVGYRSSHLRGVLTCGPGHTRPHPRLPLGRSRAMKRIRFSANGIRAFLCGAYHQPRFYLTSPRRIRRGLDLLTLSRAGHHDGLGLLSGAQSGLECGEFVDGLHPARLEFRALSLQTPPLILGGPDVLTQPGELLVDRRDRGIGLVERSQRLLGRIPAAGLLSQCTGQSCGQLGNLSFGGDQVGARLFYPSGDLQGAGFAIGAAVDPAGTHQVTVAGHRTQRGAGRDQIERGGQILDNSHPGQHRRHRTPQPRWRLEQVDRPARPGR